MMTELSLNVLDITENSISAKANFIQINIEVNSTEDFLSIYISDNGLGMTQEQINQVVDPFYTTRTTRKVGLGIPFFKYAAESTGGSFTITSKPGIGTNIHATFNLSHIDRMPLGDITSTIHTLITFNLNIDFLYSYTVDNKSFTLDTRTFRDILGNIPFNNPEISAYIKAYLQENKIEVDGGRYI